jgi:hypothetical protein
VVIGIDGPRWRLRETLIGKAVTVQVQMKRLMGIVQDTVVVRGTDPMAPGDIIALTPPPRPESDVDVDRSPPAATSGGAATEPSTPGGAATEPSTPETDQPQG